MPQVYDWVAGAKLVVPPSHFMSREEAIYNFPKLRDEVGPDPHAPVPCSVPPPPDLMNNALSTSEESQPKSCCINLS